MLDRSTMSQNHRIIVHDKHGCHSGVVDFVLDDCVVVRAKHKGDSVTVSVTDNTLFRRRHWPHCRERKLVIYNDHTAVSRKKCH